MKRVVLVVFFWGVVSIGLAGCTNRQTGGSQSVQAESGVSSASAPALPKLGSATLTVTPGSVSICKIGTRVEAEVVWDRSNPAVKGTKVTVSEPNSSGQKLFAVGGFGGRAKTGDWVVPGMIFRVYDAKTDALLASYTVGKQPCAQSAGSH